MYDVTVVAEAGQALSDLLHHYSVEVLPQHQKGIDAACALLRPGSEVFVASLPNEGPDSVVAACTRLSKAGLEPVPHLAARNIRSEAEFERTVQRLASEAGVHHALILGGDRDHAVGPYSASQQLIETGFLQRYGIRRIALAAHPEGHPRVADSVLWPALPAKLKAAEEAGLETHLVSQFAFDSAPIIALARRLRASGITVPLRVGVAGPAARTTLIKYAMMCGVGPSLRALKERHDLAKSVAAGETPEALLREVAAARAAEPSLGIDGVHFFTFAALETSIKFAEGLRAG